MPEAGELVESWTNAVQGYGVSKVTVTEPAVIAAANEHSASLGLTATVMNVPPDGHDPPSTFAPEKTKNHAFGPGSFTDVKLICT